LKKKVSIFEQENNRDRWGIRYSRRMAIMSNIFLGIWVFWSRFLKHVQRQNKGRLLGILVPKQNSSLNKILYEASMKAISKSWVFFVGTFLLTRTTSWRRHFGLGLTTCYSLYLAIFSHFLPWTNYFNMFANLLYITAVTYDNSNNNNNDPDKASTLNDFIDREVDTEYY